MSLRRPGHRNPTRASSSSHSLVMTVAACRFLSAANCVSPVDNYRYSVPLEFIGTTTTSYHGVRTMGHQQRVRRRFIFALIVVITMSAPTIGRSQEFASPEPIAAPAASYSPFAVSGTARKALPPLDCLRCVGPAPCVSCGAHHHGFLFYGTNPWDDDCAGGFDDCVHGDCGHVAAGISRAWIRLHKHRSLPFRRSHGDSCECGGPCANTCHH
jgi:hypothetical protein